MVPICTRKLHLKDLIKQINVPQIVSKERLYLFLLQFNQMQVLSHEKWRQKHIWELSPLSEEINRERESCICVLFMKAYNHMALILQQYLYSFLLKVWFFCVKCIYVFIAVLSLCVFCSLSYKTPGMID